MSLDSVDGIRTMIFTSRLQKRHHIQPDSIPISDSISKRILGGLCKQERDTFRRPSLDCIPNQAR